jgi:deoxyribose-phosphate aldolase
MIDKTNIPTTWQQMSNILDYSNLEVDARENDIRLLCLEADKFGISTVVVNPVNVKLATNSCKETNVTAACAVSFPVGGYLPDFKGLEIQEAIDDGAKNIYLLMAVGAFREGLIEKQTKPEIANLARLAGNLKTTLITEGSVLSSEQRASIVKIASDFGIKNIAVCSGFERSRLPDITNQEISEFVFAANGLIDVSYMGRVKSLERAIDLFNLGISCICTPDVRKILSEYPTFPY